VTVKFASTDTPAKFSEKTVTLNLEKRRTRWAGSNIYWDGTKLTFADTGTTDKQYYQGVYFQWGSLYGLDPSGNSSTSWSTSRTVYKPKTDGSGYDAVTGVSWGDWPQIGDADLGTDKYTNVLFDRTSASSGLGDICKYLTDKGWAPDSQTKKWRMPTLFELSEPSWGTSGSFNSWITPADVDLPAGTWVCGGMLISSDEGAFLPANGFRQGTTYNNLQPVYGILKSVNVVGYVWSACPEGRLAVPFAFNSDGARQNYSNQRECAVAVRCVRE
jgi:hypothetical protein